MCSNRPRQITASKLASMNGRKPEKPCANAGRTALPASRGSTRDCETRPPFAPVALGGPAIVADASRATDRGRGRARSDGRSSGPGGEGQVGWWRSTCVGERPRDGGDDEILLVLGEGGIEGQRDRP